MRPGHGLSQVRDKASHLTAGNKPSGFCPHWGGGWEVSLLPEPLHSCPPCAPCMGQSGSTAISRLWPRLCTSIHPRLWAGGHVICKVWMEAKCAGLAGSRLETGPPARLCIPSLILLLPEPGTIPSQRFSLAHRGSMTKAPPGLCFLQQGPQWARRGQVQESLCWARPEWGR